MVTPPVRAPEGRVDAPADWLGTAYDSDPESLASLAALCAPQGEAPPATALDDVDLLGLGPSLALPAERDQRSSAAALAGDAARGPEPQADPAPLPAALPAPPLLHRLPMNARERRHLAIVRWREKKRRRKEAVAEPFLARKLQEKKAEFRRRSSVARKRIRKNGRFATNAPRFVPVTDIVLPATDIVAPGA